MSEPDGVRADFIRMIERPEASFELARTAPLVAAESEPNVDVEGELARIEAGATSWARGSPGWNNLQKLARLRAFLFEELHFRGDQQDYFSPSNSLLHQVLHRRLGILISLGIVMLELGWRVGMPLEGVGFPSLLVASRRRAVRPAARPLRSRGMSVHEEDCRRMLAESTRGKIEFDPASSPRSASAT